MRKTIKMSEIADYMKEHYAQKDEEMMNNIYTSDSFDAHKMGMLEGLLSAFAWMGYNIEHDIDDNRKKVKKFNIL